MNKTSKVIMGLVMICLGILVILCVSGVISFGCSLKGWWTLFIIVPCIFGLIGDSQKGGPLAGIGVGVILALAANGVIEWRLIWVYLIALFAVVWGLTLIFGKGSCHGCHKHEFECKNPADLPSEDREGYKVVDIRHSFGAYDLSYSGLRFEGANINLSFGAIRLDLVGADIADKSVINLQCSFGGVEIFVDPSITVMMTSKSAFGGFDDDRRHPATDGAKTLYVSGSCSFGGVRIR